MRNGGPIQVFKQSIPASVMIRSKAYGGLIRSLVGNGRAIGDPAALIGHSRLVTNGAQENNANNQPVIADGMVAVHNGIITNDAALWGRFPSLRREYQVDTEILLRLIRMYRREGKSPGEAVGAAFDDIQGYASVAVLFGDLNHLLLATNNGSLYTTGSEAAGILVFASERYILDTLASRRTLRDLLGDRPVRRIEPGRACWIHMETLEQTPFALSHASDAGASPESEQHELEIVDLSSQYDDDFARQRVRAYSPTIGSSDDDVSLLHQHQPYVAALKRCTRCVLPETYPFITFDENGVCNHCRQHQPIKALGAEALAEKIEPMRSRSGGPDCLVALSGGRDSLYGLHYMKTVLGMNTVAYTYDWGMVTDLARRNISRICGQLGVEHLLVSADINRKRANIRRNILAWLRKPDLGVIPLFMAGDKSFFYYATRLQKQTGIDLVVWCSGSGFESANFKWLFCGIHDRHKWRSRLAGEYKIDASTSPAVLKLRLMGYYGRQFLTNPAYLNPSLLDTLFGYYSYYLLPRDFLYLYKYLPWDENEILSVLTHEYDWEQSSDTRQTWRIGDGTASFYNYIYHTVAGFSENDTFRSEQVRRGMITRAQAVEFITQENEPRYDSIKWYLGVIGLGDAFNHVIRTINAIPKHYPTN
ncbi:MAG: hypothetical protein ACE5E1_02885 [Phycisphaerae bacterium]